MQETLIITDREELKKHSPYALRLVIHYYGGGESWRKYLILNRRKILYDLKRAKTKKAKEFVVDNYKPGWYDYYRGPGYGFAREPYTCHKNKRFIVIAQSGGLDI